MTSAKPFVSVVIAARNSAAGMPELLSCLRNQTLPADQYEVIIVDDSSTDATAAAAAEGGFAIVPRTETRGGAYVARNLGLAHARGDVIAVTDADCRPTPDWLRHGLEDLDALDVDLVGGHIDVPLRRRPTAAELVDFCRYLDQKRALEEAGFGATANLFVRRRVFDEVGLFNDRVISGGDREFCLRATGAGFKIAYSPRAAIVHEPRLTAKELMRKCYRMGIGRAQMHAHGEGPAANRPRIWSSPGAYLLRRGVYGMERLGESGFQPSRFDVWRMQLAQYFCVQLPLIGGNLVGSFRENFAR
jgi:glycosyltransferase involved in cell wall biosynthesis